LARVRADGTIRVGFANEAPYAYASPDGKLVGIMPDVISYVMAQLGVPAVEGVLTEFGGLIPGLQAKRFDLLGAGLYVRPDRCEQVAPSNPEYTVGEGMVALKGNPKNLKSYPDIANSDAKIGTLSGSVNVEYLQISKVPDSRVVLFPDLPTAIAGLQAGRVDAVTMSAPSLQDVLQKAGDSNLQMVDGFVDPVDKDGKATRGFGAAWFRLEDTDLRDAYNAELAKIIESGKLLELMAPYGFTKDQVPSVEVTAAKLCGN
jgi:polar amino acid transport system substrate-binding protein